MLLIVDQERLPRMLAAMHDPDEFLSEHGLRALSSYHRANPLHVDGDGVATTLDYEPGESTSGPVRRQLQLAGPIWFPINVLLIDAVQLYHRLRPVFGENRRFQEDPPGRADPLPGVLPRRHGAGLRSPARDRLDRPVAT